MSILKLVEASENNVSKADFEIVVAEATDGRMYTQEELDNAVAEAVEIEAAYEYEEEPDSLPAH